MTISANKFPIYLSIALLSFLCLRFFMQNQSEYIINSTTTYSTTDAPIQNPHMGIASDAEKNPDSLAYIEVTFRELQPDSPDSYAFSAIDRKNNVSTLKARGKHAVLRFIADKPGDSIHTDLPDWLMSETDDGSYYALDFGMGYSPNYSNETFIFYHQKAVKALADHYDDGFVSFVEIGSLGHLGNWHIQFDSGLEPIPRASVQSRYISHYTDAFQNAKLLLPFPFYAVKQQNLGLYNTETENNTWIKLIEKGGNYTESGEKSTLFSVPDFWKTAPSGYHYSTEIAIDTMISSIQNAHTTYMVSKEIPDSKVKDTLVKNMGYRLGVTRVSIIQERDSDEISVCLDWVNEGLSPLYFDLPAYLYNQKNAVLANVDIELPSLLPGEKLTTETVINKNVVPKGTTLYLGIADPMTGKPAVKLVSNQEEQNRLHKLYTF